MSDELLEDFYSYWKSQPDFPYEPGVDIPHNKGLKAEWPGQLGGWPKGKPKSEEFRKKISEAQTGKRRGPLKGRKEYHPKYLAYLKRIGKFQD